MHEPKDVFYPRSRTTLLQRTYLKQVLLAADAMDIDRLAGYFLTSLTPDHSLSAIMAHARLPWLLRKIVRSGSLPQPSRTTSLVGRFSEDAIHMAFLVLNAPVLVALVNPSSLSVLLDRLSEEWDRVRDELRGILSTESLRAALRGLRGPARQREIRLRDFITRPHCPTVPELLPELRVVYCWDGGYVGPFMDRLRAQLADVQPRFFPMFCLSTETVAYEIFPRITTRGGMPVYPGVCYEFLSIDAAPTAANVAKPWDLNTGGRYEMVISDSYGLVRYRTEDVFECLGVEQDTPVLRFVGRGGLTYSFTGEKISGEQLVEVYERVRRDLRCAGAAFTCFPKLHHGGVPGYVFVCCPAADGALPDGLSGGAFDGHLVSLNTEYAAKRRSGRLAPPALVVEPYQSLRARLLTSERSSEDTNPHQFKLLPLYRTFWDS